MRRHCLISFPILSAALLPVFTASAEPANPAHSLAQKFAVEAKPQTAAKAAPPVVPRAPAAKPTADYEKEMLDAAKAEAEARRLMGQTAMPPAVPATAPSPQPQPDTPKTVELKPADAAPPEIKKVVSPAPVAPALPMQFKIKAEIRTPVVNARPPVPAQPVTAPAVTADATPPATATPAAQTAAVAPPSRDAATPRATVLVVLTQGGADHGSLPKTPDPIICLGEACFVSAGPGTDARAISRAEALSTKNTVTTGAGACSGKSRCAFRGIPVTPGSALQIIDLGLVRHDSRDTVEAKVDTSCGVDDADLVCDNPLTAPDFRIWLVPETVASNAGPKSLEAALADDLPEENVARAGDK